MRRIGCQNCNHTIDFCQLEMQTSYPGITGYTCSACSHVGKVFSGIASGYFDTTGEVLKNDDENNKAARKESLTQTEGLIYLASPYSHDEETIRDLRFLLVCKAAATLMRRGQLVFSPIAHTHPIAAHGLPGHWKFWERYDRKMIALCDRLVVLTLPGWEKSTGVQAEIRIAQELGKDVSYLDQED